MNLNESVATENEVFGKRVETGRRNYDAESERSIMLAEFNAWAIRARLECEHDLIMKENFLANTAPFARAGMESAETPADLPNCVIEFTLIALQLIEVKREMALFNLHHKKATLRACESMFASEPEDEAEMLQLWAKFMESRAKAK